MKRLTRKQPRRLTPPLFLRNAAGEREVVEVDHELVTSAIQASTRTTAFILLAPGLRVSVGSRCVNKRRVPVLRIAPRDAMPPAWRAPNAYQAARAQFENGGLS